MPFTRVLLLLLMIIAGSTSWTTISGLAAEPGVMPNLAPGVLTIVPAIPEEEETTSPPVPLAEITSRSQQWQPNYDAPSETLNELAQEVILRRPVWQLEFAYKSLRMIKLDAPGSDSRRNVWYLVYQVRNAGRHPAPIPRTDEFGHDEMVLRKANLPIRFFPGFRLRDHETGREWLDQVVAEALPRIHAVEIRDRSVPLYDSVTISAVQLDVSSDATDRGVWAVAMWEGVDPRADFVSVYVQGLSNAYRWEPSAKDTPQLTYKTLKLNFWRPGDPVDQHVGEFRNGLPSFDGAAMQRALKAYDLNQPLLFTWVYRP